MRAPDFWWRKPGLAALALSPFAAVYGAVAGARMRKTGAPAPVPVLCVGNFVAGGAGKTPAALALAARLGAMGYSPVFLSRGYGGSLAGPVRVDSAQHGPADVGDEPLLLSRAGPVVVARDRPAGAALAAAHGDVVVMDDGLQNPSLRKDLSLAVVDAATGIGNGMCIPAGPLRAPLAAQWPAVDAVILVGEGEAGEAVARLAQREGKPVLWARLSPDGDAAEGLAGARVLAFAGIGRPEKFFATLRHAGARVERTRAFADHRPYMAGEIAALLAEAEGAGLLPVTTEKDMVRVRAAAPDLAARIAVLPVVMRFEDEPALGVLLDRFRRTA
jgi:tetraacyldisaccharide 4'-kinase